MSRPLSLTDQRANDVLIALRGWNTENAAAAFAGVAKATFYDWLRRGRQLSEAVALGKREWSDLNDNERRLALFSDQVRQTVANTEVATIAAIGDAGRLPQVETRRHRKCVGLDDNGQPIMVEEVTTTERPPNLRALTWIAEHRYADWRPTFAHTGPDGGPVQHEHRVESLIGRMAELRTGRAIDVESEPA